jgi:hypothetical protein
MFFGYAGVSLVMSGGNIEIHTLANDTAVGDNLCFRYIRSRSIDDAINGNGLVRGLSG